jgi:hypothetical protein
LKCKNAALSFAVQGEISPFFRGFFPFFISLERYLSEKMDRDVFIRFKEKGIAECKS